MHFLSVFVQILKNSHKHRTAENFETSGNPIQSKMKYTCAIPDRFLSNLFLNMSSDNCYRIFPEEFILVLHYPHRRNFSQHKSLSARFVLSTANMG